MELFQNPVHIIILVPLLAAAIGLEAYFYKQRRHKACPWRESGLSLVVAIGHAASGIINHAVVVSLIAVLVWKTRIYTMPMDEWWAWVLLFVGVEFVYYWYHREAHRVRLMWATHSVHHSLLELTLASGYRFAWTPVLSLSWLFYAPLIFLGFNPVSVFILVGISLAYQFPLHCTLIPKLGPLEWILNTPSAHRVHHGSNPEYLDKNFGGIVILFDRLFGTYAAENDAIPIRYGLVHNVDTVNPLVIVYGQFFNLIRDMIKAPSWRERWRLMIKPPGWTPQAA
jgi:sterol desaturase/sphingolipid hydroxylase (fatty acid hydroxylase superfamily)